MSGIIGRGSKTGIIGGTPKFNDVSWDGTDVVTPVACAATSTMTASTNYDLGTVAIPEEGIYYVFCNLRWAFTDTNAGYVRVGLHSGTGITNQKMQFEQLGAAASTANINLHTSFIVNFHNYPQYPMDVILRAFNTTENGKFLQNDSNGINNYGAIKIARSSTTSSGTTQIGL